MFKDFPISKIAKKFMKSLENYCNIGRKLNDR